MNSIPRFLLSLASAGFSLLGGLYWLAPDTAASWFGITAVYGRGLVNLRADMGALFLGLGACCGLGAWTARRGPLLAARWLLATILVGRGLGWAHNGGTDGGGAEFLIEMAVFATVLWLLRGAREAPIGHAATATLPRRIAIAVGALALAAIGLLQLPPVQQALYAAGASAKTARSNTAPLADDALRVAIAGSSAPLPSRERAKACVVVFVAGRFWVVDAGPESVENLLLWGIPMARIGGVLLTHFHSDHIGDLGELQLQTWAAGRQEPLAVYGGPGVETVVDGMNRAYRLDQGYRTAHHGEAVMPSAAWGMRAVTVDLVGPPTAAKDRTAIVLDDGDLRITAIEVDHAPIAPAYAYRFDYKGRSAVVTGDMKYHPPLVRSAAEADLLVSEAIARSMTEALETAARAGERGRTAAIMHDVQDYHISPEEAAQIANAAHVRHLAYYHLLPAPDTWLARQLFARGVNRVRASGWSVTDDGSLFTMPIGSDVVQIGRIDG